MYIDRDMLSSHFSFFSILLTKSFDEQYFLILTWFNWSIFFFMVRALFVLFKKFCLP